MMSVKVFGVMHGVVRRVIADGNYCGLSRLRMEFSAESFLRFTVV